MVRVKKIVVVLCPKCGAELVRGAKCINCCPSAKAKAEKPAQTSTNPWVRDAARKAARKNR